jgi:hypothetical protein
MTKKKQPTGKESIYSLLEGDLEEEYFKIIRSGKTVKQVIKESWKS